jgi:peptidoglycan-associated lipoprotein
MKSYKVALVLVLVFTVGFLACKKKEAPVPQPQEPEQTETVEVAVVEVAPVPIIEFDFRPVQFDYNKALLSKTARTILRRNAQFLIDNPDVKVTVEGYCDDIGSLEYNLNLGQKRANAVQRFYVRLGIVKERIETVSYGKKNPLYKGKSKLVRKLNRRVETKVQKDI